ncbi:MAG: Crp/Fnr family transcriptional regulator [Bacteroidota bacterium]
MSSINELLKENFPELQESELLAEMDQVGRIARYKMDDKVMDYGGNIQKMPLLISGSLKIMRQDEQGNELILYYLQSGETCAISLTCFLTDQKSEIRAIAEEDLTLVMLPANLMDPWMLKYPSWKNFVMNTYRARFEELLNTIDSIAFHKMDERLWRYLVDKSTINNSHTLETTHQKIADELNSTREVISRLLKQLEKQGKIELGRNKISVRP